MAFITWIESLDWRNRFCNFRDLLGVMWDIWSSVELVGEPLINHIRTELM
jgi:hypothetical protein